MLYIFIDESGDTGNIKHMGTSSGFSMCACLCVDTQIDFVNREIEQILLYIKKKEIKYSKLSDVHKKFVVKKLKHLPITCYSYYYHKDNILCKDALLTHVFESVIMQVLPMSGARIKIVIDGRENARYRKIYSNVLDKYIKKYILKFADSIKTPMLQIADVYAGICREKKG
jgi:ribosomal protein S4E